MKQRDESLLVSNSLIPKVFISRHTLKYLRSKRNTPSPPHHYPAKSNSPQLIGKVTFKKLSERWGQHPIRSGGMIKFSIIASRLRRAQILTAGRGLSLYLYDPTSPTPPANPRQPPNSKFTLAALQLLASSQPCYESVSAR